MSTRKKSNLKRCVVGFLSVCILALGIFTLVSLASIDKTEAAQPHEHFVIATASGGGTWYILGSGLGMIIDQASPDLDVEAILSGGSVDNVKLVNSGEVESGFCASDPAWAAYNGLGSWEEKLDNFRVITKLPPGPPNIVVLENSDIKSMRDLKGKKVAVGPAKGGTVKTLKTVLPYFNMSFDDFSPVYVGYAESCAMLEDGRVDATAMKGAPPLQAVKELSAERKIRLISFSKEALDKILEGEFLYEAVTIPKEAYGLEQDAVTATSRGLFIVNKDVEEDVVYQVTKSIFENLDQVYKVHPAAVYITLEDAITDVFPMHPGAMRYYREKGIVEE